MRIFSVVMQSLALAACTQPSQQPVEHDAEQTKLLPEFRFRSLTPGVALSAVKGILSACEPAYGNTNDTYCELKDTEVAGVMALDTFVTFENRKWRGLVIDYHPNMFDQVVTGLTSAYGEPCRTDRQELQNAFGATFQDESYQWCFKGGDLTIRRYADKIDLSQLVYQPHLPTKAPEKYTPQSL